MSAGNVSNPPPFDPAELATRFSTLLRAQGLTHQALARKSGLSRSQVRRMARGEGKVGPRQDTITRAARALGVEPAFLAYGVQP